MSMVGCCESLFLTSLRSLLKNTQEVSYLLRRTRPLRRDVYRVTGVGGEGGSEKEEGLDQHFGWREVMGCSLGLLGV